MSYTPNYGCIQLYAFLSASPSDSNHCFVYLHLCGSLADASEKHCWTNRVVAVCLTEVGVFFGTSVCLRVAEEFIHQQFRRGQRSAANDKSVASRLLHALSDAQATKQEVESAAFSRHPLRLNGVAEGLEASGPRDDRAEDRSVSSSSSASSASSQRSPTVSSQSSSTKSLLHERVPSLLSIRMTVDAFTPELAISEFRTNFRYDEFDGVAALPILSDWLEPLEFARVKAWCNEQVNAMGNRKSPPTPILNQIRFRVPGSGSSVFCAASCEIQEAGPPKSAAEVRSEQGKQHKDEKHKTPGEREGSEDDKQQEGSQEEEEGTKGEEEGSQDEEEEDDEEVEQEQEEEEKDKKGGYLVQFKLFDGFTRSFVRTRRSSKRSLHRGTHSINTHTIATDLGIKQRPA
ncbi:unnamed protein product [Polarella glacialis]|uniref:Uncharacterized protein n=1 Tax=Polarella glacialis TaxID=89957 RepID=A0A813JSL1_POLGL|nr:unnamed protein product [Polarella glacialis]